MGRNSPAAWRRRLGEGHTKSRKQSPGRSFTVEPESVLKKLVGMSADTDRITAQLVTKYNSAAQFEFRLNQQETWQVGQKEICLILSIFPLLFL